MKRALAERAKQSLNAAVTNAKEQKHEQQSHNFALPQAPAEFSSTMTNALLADTSSSLPSKHTEDSNHDRLRVFSSDERRPEEGANIAPSLSTGSPSLERPLKIPRLEMTIENGVELQINSSSLQLSHSPRALAHLSKAAAPNANCHPQRRNSLDSQPQRVGSESAKSKKKDEAEEDYNAAFYLKHQNRALATELKSLQFAVSQLEEERMARRSHCHEALQAVNELHSIWSDIEDQTIGPLSSSSVTSYLVMDTSQDPPSSGTGDSVEWTRALQNALVALGRPTERSPDSSSDTDNLRQAVSSIAARASVLREWLENALTSGSIPRSSQQVDNSTADQRQPNLLRDMALMTARCNELKAQVSELAASRQDVVSRERRVRRNIYRMEAGMLSPEQVANTLEHGDEDHEIEAAVLMEKQRIRIDIPSESVTAELKQEETSETEQSSNRISSTQADEFYVKISSLEEAVFSAERAVGILNAQLSEKERRITELSKRQLSDDDAARLESLQSTSLQLKTSASAVLELQSKLSKAESKWSLALGNEKTALAAVEELVSKFNKRWSEFTCRTSTADNVATEDVDSEVIIASLPEDNPQVVMAKQIAELQHKLDQALENVRQSETTRENLKVALAMNGSLQGKLDEFKAKYAALQASRSHAGNVASSRAVQGGSHNAADATAKTISSAITKEKDASSSLEAKQKEEGRSIEKLHRDYRRARKELATMTASKEATKAKFERTEKERDGLLESNVRLLKQIGEKDEMNAKSLSTILHLKSMTEKLTEERENLELQAKTASQLALAARLATNAKERVSEEVLHEKNAIGERLEELEKKNGESQVELERVSAEWSAASGKMAVKESELANAMTRSDELVSEIEQKREEVRKLLDVVATAQRVARDAKEKLAIATKSGVAIGDGVIGVASEGTPSFSVDQLQTQVSVLKSRLACPVCHYRDKECIILRCRHMHCKQCVDERISNRSRKCPTCNIKFAENEVGDVWLS